MALLAHSNAMDPASLESLVSGSRPLLAPSPVILSSLYSVGNNELPA